MKKHSPGMNLGKFLHPAKTKVVVSMPGAKARIENKMVSNARKLTTSKQIRKPSA